VADGSVHADVVAGVAGLDPLVFEDLVALFEEELPELGPGDCLGDFGLGALSVVVLVLCEGRDRELEKIEGGGGELHRGGCLGFLLRDDGEGAASGDVVLGDEDQVAASGQIERVGPGVDLGQLFFGEGDGDGGLLRGAFFHEIWHSKFGVFGCVK